MSNKTYPAADIDQILTELLGTVEEALVATKSATDLSTSLQVEVDALRNKAAGQHQVVLEKVAGIDPDVLEETMDVLLDHSYIDAGQREKVAKELTSDPEAVFRMLARVAQLSVSSPSQGRGLPKSAAVITTESDPDGWGLLLERR